MIRVLLIAYASSALTWRRQVLFLAGNGCEWICRGFFVGNGAQSATGPWVITTQVYGFGDTFGEATLVIEGYEITDIDVAIMRGVSTGTGPFAAARGEGEQTLLGFNATEGVSLMFEIDVTE